MAIFELSPKVFNWGWWVPWLSHAFVVFGEIVDGDFAIDSFEVVEEFEWGEGAEFGEVMLFGFNIFAIDRVDYHVMDENFGCLEGFVVACVLCMLAVGFCTQ